MKQRVKTERGSGNAFTDLGFSRDEAANLTMRSLLMMKLEDWYQASGLTQAQAAKTIGVTQPRLNLLLKGRIDLFSLDALVNMATLAGMRLALTIKPVAGVKVARAKRVTPSTTAKKGTAVQPERKRRAA